MTDRNISSRTATTRRDLRFAGTIAAGSLPDALYWDDGDPYHYVRLRETADPAWMQLLVGGEDHKTGQDDDPEAYARLQAWARERFPMVGDCRDAWSGQVLEPVDGLAYLGADPDNGNVWLVTDPAGGCLGLFSVPAAKASAVVGTSTQRWAAGSNTLATRLR